ncbi:PRD domain-containing protein [Clostridium sp.]|uniref:PRD domain-containing protein n=1 Tax=Clostridium sp. TaxID=1506 RepID=UPI002601BB4F
MKMNKDLILEFIQNWSVAAQAREGLSTQFLSDSLKIDRANVSRILNQLVKEKIIEKVVGRPVLYRIIDNKSIVEQSCFHNLIGYDGSLRESIQFAKAAIMYPSHCLSTLIMGPNGCGKRYFTKKMIQYAIEQDILSQDDNHIHINCLDYPDDYKRIKEVFSLAINELNQVKKGVIYIEHIELLSTSLINEVIGSIDYNSKNIVIIATCDDEISESFKNTLIKNFDINIKLQGYQSRPILERFQLIEKFFTDESTSMQKELHVNAKLIYCLLMYDCLDNIAQLKRDIKIGCANGYVRKLDSNKSYIYLAINDFPNYVGRGILKYKTYHQELKSIISENSKYVFTKGDVKREEALDESESIYDVVNNKVSDLENQGLNREDISMIINADIEKEFEKYSNNLSEQVINIDQLSKVVSEKLIYMVSHFLRKVSVECERFFPESILYGLCLHLHETILRRGERRKLKKSQIHEILGKYPTEYALTIDFVSLIDEEFNVDLPIDEVVFITMFLCDHFYENKETKKPVLLIGMHGESTATSICDSVNNLVKETIAYGFDMPLEQSPMEAYERLKSLILDIDRGAGILFMYDMGSLKTMVEMISEEIDIQIKVQEVPVTLLAIDYARKCLMSHTLKEVFDKIKPLSFESDVYYEKASEENEKKTIITLCMSGQGGAVQMKEYIEEVLGDFPVKVIPLAISDDKELLLEINEIRKNTSICCVVGTFNPNIYPYVPFVSVSELFETDRRQLRKLLHLHHPDYLSESSIYNNLEESLLMIEGSEIKKNLPPIIDRLELLIDKDFSKDQSIGLFMHMSALIDRLIQGEKSQSNNKTAKIKDEYYKLFEEIKKILKILERKFKIRFCDDDIAIILSYIKEI